MQAIKPAGYVDAHGIWIAQLVALNRFATFLNLIAPSDTDIPLVTQREVAFL